MKLVNALQTNNKLTENEMPTHSTSGEYCVDFFGSIGSCRNWPEQDIINAFVKALVEDPLVAMRILFWTRDARGGAGERRAFRICSQFLDNNSEYRNLLYKNLHLIPFFGRWDDLFLLDDPIVFGMISEGLEAGDGLLAKWLPRKGKFASKIRREFGLSPKEYRKMIVALSNTVEQKMCAKKWDEIVYEHVPSVAFHKYRKAFARNDQSRFQQFIEACNRGEKKVKADVLFPYQLYQAFQKGEDKAAIEAQWKNLINYIKDNPERMLPVCDTSGSMTNSYGKSTLTPMDISVSLGVYISERNIGPFKDAFITFSHRPKLQVLKGSVCQRFAQLQRAEWEMNTDLEAVFNLILRQGKRYNVPESEMPTMILIISDMQFDRCIKNESDNALSMIKRQYKEAGYRFPKVIFWNVNARIDQMPVKARDKNTAIVSGCSPAILKSILSGKQITPYDMMMETVNSERYQQVQV